MSEYYNKGYDDRLLDNAACALQDAYDYLEKISFNDSELEQCKTKIQECWQVINYKGIEDE